MPGIAGDQGCLLQEGRRGNQTVVKRQSFTGMGIFLFQARRFFGHRSRDWKMDQAFDQLPRRRFFLSPHSSVDLGHHDRGAAVTDKRLEVSEIGLERGAAAKMINQDITVDEKDGLRRLIHLGFNLPSAAEGSNVRANSALELGVGGAAPGAVSFVQSLLHAQPAQSGFSHACEEPRPLACGNPAQERLIQGFGEGDVELVPLHRKTPKDIG